VITDDDLDSWLQTEIDPQLRDALDELKRSRDERTAEFVALREALWARIEEAKLYAERIRKLESDLEAERAGMGWIGRQSTATDDGLATEIKILEDQAMRTARVERGLAWLRELARLRLAPSSPIGAYTITDAELRGFQLIRLHLDEGGHDWRVGTAVRDVHVACALIDRLLGAVK